MKALKIILYIVLGVVAVLAIAVFAIPIDYHVERSVTIAAPQKLAMQQAGRYENFVKWNPWNKLDPNITYTIEGEDGSVGAKYSWEGNDQVGKGYMVTTKVAANRIDQDLVFFTPMESEAETYLAFESADNSTKVTWAMEGHNPRPFNIMIPLMNRMLGADFEKGLSSLKSQTEAVASSNTFRGFTIETIALPQRNYIGKRDTVGFDEFKAFYTSVFGEVFTALKKRKIKPTGAPSGLYFFWDEGSKTTDIMAGIPISEEISSSGFEVFPLSGRAVKIAYQGSYEGMMLAHQAMDDYFTAKGLEPGKLVIEEYVTDPMSEPDTTQWLTNIYYLLP